MTPPNLHWLVMFLWLSQSDMRLSLVVFKLFASSIRCFLFLVIMMGKIIKKALPITLMDTPRHVLTTVTLICTYCLHLAMHALWCHHLSFVTFVSVGFWEMQCQLTAVTSYLGKCPPSTLSMCSKYSWMLKHADVVCFPLREYFLVTNIHK